MSRKRTLAAAAACLFVFATSAAAQDYDDVSLSSQWVTPPGSETNLNLSENSSKPVTLPFSFPYFGGSYDRIYVHDNGFLQIAPAVAPTGSPTGNTTFPSSSSANDGMVAPCWDSLGMGSGAAVVYWTDGTAPNRRHVVAWVDIPVRWLFFTYQVSAQVQLYEGTGRIVFAYAGGSSGWNRMSYSTGIEAPGLSDTRSVSPGGRTSNNLSGTPTHYEFLPHVTTVSGRVVADKAVVDATGIGNSVVAGLPLAMLPVELVSGSGSLLGTLTTDATGAFAATFMGIDGSGTGTVRVLAKTPNCTVRKTGGGPPIARVLEDELEFGVETALGTVVLDDTSDPDADFRGPWNITQVVESAHAWAAARADDAIPAVGVLYDPASAEVTSYSQPGTALASLRVAGPGAANPDPWDDDVIARLFGEHVLYAVSLGATSPVSSAFDRRTTDAGAFAEAFSYYVASLIGGSAELVDGLDADTVTVVDLEDPRPVTGRGPDVTAWVAAALHDLADAANEPHDTEDGTGLSGERPFTVVDRMDGAVNAQLFYDAWGDEGFPGAALSRNFIHHGLIADDSDEPNDAAAEAAALGPVGFRDTGHTLNRYNDDWFEVDLPEPTGALTAQVVYDRETFTATLELQVVSTTGLVLATGALEGDEGGIRAVTGPLDAGAYRIRVAHTTGGRIDEYTLIAFAQLELTAEPFPDWTRDRAYVHPVTPRGGIPPYELKPNPGFPLPVGFTVETDPPRVRGAAEQTGRFLVELVLNDSADPENEAAYQQEIRIAEPLGFAGSPFIGVAEGRLSSASLGFSGGTAPLLTTIASGTLPAGIDLLLDPPRFEGSTTEGGSRRIRVDSVDVAGSATSTETTVVTCAAMPAKKSPVALAAGDAATGFFVDALAGSRISVKVGTSKGRAKRVLEPVVIDADGLVLESGSVKGGRGKATVKKVTAPETGRYFVILASGDGEETELVGTPKAVAAKAGKGALDVFVPGETLALEIAGFASSRFTLKGKTDRSAGNVALFIGLLGPNNETIAPGALDVRVAGHKFTVSGTLPSPGTWKALINAQAGNRGSFKYSFKLKHPKGVVFDAP